MSLRLLAADGTLAAWAPASPPTVVLHVEGAGARARAVSADGSRFSDDDSSNVFTFPATPVSLSATEEGQNVRLNWSNNGNSQNDPQTNYQIQIANAPAFNDARVKQGLPGK